MHKRSLNRLNQLPINNNNDNKKLIFIATIYLVNEWKLQMRNKQIILEDNVDIVIQNDRLYLETK